MNKSEFKEKANDAFKGVTKTARFMTLISKKRMEIALLRKEIDRKYTKLGKIFYKDFVTDEEPDDAEYVPLCDAISENFRRINKLKEEIKDLNDDYFDRKEAADEESDIEDIEIIPTDVAAADTSDIELFEEDVILLD